VDTNRTKHFQELNLNLASYQDLNPTWNLVSYNKSSTLTIPTKHIIILPHAPLASTFPIWVLIQ